MKRRWKMVSVVLVLSFGQCLLSSPAEARSWTCWAKISLLGSSWTYAPPDWSMSGGTAADRQKKCLTHIQDNWTGHGEDPSTAQIWKLLNMDTANQDHWCKGKEGTFVIIYGFDKRDKQWRSDQNVKTNCKCSGGEVFQ